MNTLFQINADDLDIKFIDSIKTLFKNKNIIISISEDIDETAYLLQSTNNSKRLLNALEEVKNNKSLMAVKTIEELKKLVNNEKNNSN